MISSAIFDIITIRKENTEDGVTKLAFLSSNKEVFVLRVFAKRGFNPAFIQSDDALNEILDEKYKKVDSDDTEKI